MPEHDPVPTTSHRVTELIEFGRDREAAELGGTQLGSLGGSEDFSRATAPTDAEPDPPATDVEPSATSEGNSTQ